VGQDKKPGRVEVIATKVPVRFLLVLRAEVAAEEAAGDAVEHPDKTV
jgi:hypothetical protein